MKLRVSEKERKKKQHKRLLEDFPWLWAIRNSWLLGFHEIKVCQVNYFQQDSEIWRTLNSEVSDDLEVWVVAQNGNLKQISKVSVAPDTPACWARKITWTVPTGYLITHIIAIQKLATGRESFIIYRAPKVRSFNWMVVDIAQAFEEKQKA